MISSTIFILAHDIGDRSFYSTFRQVSKNQWKPFKEKRIDQEKQLRHLINYSYEQVPYYRSLFKDLNIQPRMIQKFEDLEKLPVV